jgi:hypothetical protein
MTFSAASSTNIGNLSKKVLFAFVPGMAGPWRERMMTDTSHHVTL